MTNNKLKNKPQTSTVFYLAQRNYSSAQSICNWHRLNKKLQPLKALFIISCKSADFTVNYSDKGLQTINTAHRITAGLAASSEGRIRKLTTWRPFSRDTPPTPPLPVLLLYPLPLCRLTLPSLLLSLPSPRLAEAGRPASFQQKDLMVVKVTAEERLAKSSQLQLCSNSALNVFC